MDDLKAQIEQADELEALVSLYVEHHAAWTPAHTLTAARTLLGIFEHKRFRELDDYYHNQDYNQ